MSRFLAPRLQALDAYTPGEQPRDMVYTKLNTNESPFAPPQAVIDAVSAAEVADLRLYPDPTCRQLKEKLAEVYGVKAENVFVANGSDDILNFAFMAYSGNGVTYPAISYGFYSVYAALYGADAVEVPLKEDFGIEPADYFAARGMVVIANPNAPTGIALSLDQVESIVAANTENVVLIDEAYVDFGGESALPLIDKYDNLLVVRTYSKSRSLAGARLGFAFASPAIIADLEKIKYSTNPYAINRLTLVAGHAALEAEDYYKNCCAEIIKNRDDTAIKLRELGFSVLPSCANFLFAKHESISGVEIYTGLKQRGVLVRHFSKPLIADYNRITIGTKEDMQRLIAALQELIGGRK